MARAPGEAIHWEIDDRQWILGTEAMPAVLGAVAEAHVDGLVKDGFAKSQEVVPVDTGALHDSGRIEKSQHGLETVWTVIYGGVGEVDYAGYVETQEPYLEPSMVGAAGGFESAGNMLDSSPAVQGMQL